MRTASNGDVMKVDKIARRRGSRLEDAILDAAWAELVERGYPGFTLEGVAKRADTSRPVLHRRWPSRTALAVAATARQFALNPVEIPDLGSLGNEMKLLLRHMSDRARPDMIRLMFDMQKDIADAKSNFIELRDQIVKPRAVQAMLARAIARGEVDPSQLTPRIVSLPTDLARHEMLMTFKPISEQALDEIVDAIFLPLVRAKDG